jgi:hypothetical protein
MTRAAGVFAGRGRLSQVEDGHPRRDAATGPSGYHLHSPITGQEGLENIRGCPPLPPNAMTPVAPS